MRAIEETIAYPPPHFRLGNGFGRGPGLGVFPGYSMSNECCDSPAWDSWYHRLRFALFVIFLVYYVFGMPLVFWWTRRKGAAASNKILNRYVYLTAVGFTALYLLLATIAEGLSNCQKINPLRYVKIWVAANTFRYLANLLILYLIILPVSDRMMKHAAWNHHPLLGHWILLALVAIFALIFVVMWNYNLIHSITGEKITDTEFGAQATFVTLYLVAALYAAGHLVAARFRSLRNKAGQKGLLPWCPMLAVGLVGYAFRDFSVIFAFYVVRRGYTTTASTVFVVLGLVFQAVVFLSLPFLAAAPALEEEPAERLTKEQQEQK
ncbi:hypothetical protein QBC34DRAFT_402909 [Podospora aff. communis PSN243]|uniref:Uncharacterized protein n=1 Tax=Podospora aff. communis PSN243 TaxID=3040156 RepID=A0AAV9GSQ1_9PEZI|nr:hypothetical protein QBC34DRAFT_402909 [Podospora aff. communis PSN243]